MTEEDVKTFGGEVALGRPGQPDELAPAYVFLASDDASFMTARCSRNHRRQAVQQLKRTVPSPSLSRPEATSAPSGA